MIITGRTIGALEELMARRRWCHATIVEQDWGSSGRPASSGSSNPERRGDGMAWQNATLGTLTPLSHLDQNVWDDDTINRRRNGTIKATEPLIAAPAGRAHWFHPAQHMAVYPFRICRLKGRA